MPLSKFIVRIYELHAGPLALDKRILCIKVCGSYCYIQFCIRNLSFIVHFFANADHFIVKTIGFFIKKVYTFRYNFCCGPRKSQQLYDLKRIKKAHCHNGNRP